MNDKQLLLLTGAPGVGKTTIVKSIVKKLKERKISCRGFFTEEVRSPAGGNRIGFDVVTLHGKRGTLARKNLAAKTQGHQVGQYSVYLHNFEELAMPQLLLKDSRLLVIDEIGKMELFSKRFEKAINTAISQLPMLATIPLKTGNLIPFVERLRSSRNCTIFEVTKTNRQEIENSVMEALMELFQT